MTETDYSPLTLICIELYQESHQTFKDETLEIKIVAF